MAKDMYAIFCHHKKYYFAQTLQASQIIYANYSFGVQTLCKCAGE